jgi:hypothetical protein
MPDPVLSTPSVHSWMTSVHPRATNIHLRLACRRNSVALAAQTALSLPFGVRLPGVRWLAFRCGPWIKILSRIKRTERGCCYYPAAGGRGITVWRKPYR